MAEKEDVFLIEGMTCASCALTIEKAVNKLDNVDNAVKIARKFDYGIRMVTIEGELLVPGGAISGGAFKNNSNLLSRRREIEAFEQKVKEHAQKIKDLQEEIETIKSNRNKLRMDLERIKAELQMKFIQQNTARISV